MRFVLAEQDGDGEAAVVDAERKGGLNTQTWVYMSRWETSPYIAIVMEETTFVGLEPCFRQLDVEYVLCPTEMLLAPTTAWIPVLGPRPVDPTELLIAPIDNGGAIPPITRFECRSGLYSARRYVPISGMVSLHCRDMVRTMAAAAPCQVLCHEKRQY